jgi:hypothetical protein
MVTPADTRATLQALAGPSTLVVVGAHQGAAARTRTGGVQFFDQQPGSLVDAAAAIHMPVCSVELDDLAAPSAPADGTGVAIDAALAECDRNDLGDMLDRLNGLKTDATVVIIAANAGITVRSTNNGVNYFYDADIVRLLRAARKLYVAACVIAPSSLAIPTYPQGQRQGLSVDQALASCGRL